MDDAQEYKSTIHGRSVSTGADDDESRRYLRELDNDEAKVIFDQAKRRGTAEFEVRRNGTRENYSAGYKNGKYTVKDEGKQKSSGWF